MLRLNFFRGAARHSSSSTAGAGKIHVSEQTHVCMRSEGRPLVRLLEHGLPQAVQTHEMIVDRDSQSVIATQMEEGRLVKLKYDDQGEIGCGASWVHMNLQSSLGKTPEQLNKDEPPFVGMHGLSESFLFPGRIWVTLQYE